MQYTYQDVFSTAQNSFWTRCFWCLLVLLPCLFVCLCHLFHISKTFPFDRKKNKVPWGEIGWIRRVGHGGHAVFHQKLLNTQRSVGRCACKSPIMKWANTLKSLQKNSLKLDTASHNNTSWYTDTDGFLEHSPSRESMYYKGTTLQKIIHFGEDPSFTHVTWMHMMSKSIFLAHSSL